MKSSNFYVQLRFLIILSVLAFFCAGCISSSPRSCPVGTELLFDPDADPLEGYNRSVQVFNENVNRHLLRPVSQAYNFVIPEFARDAVHNFGQNLLYPLRVINCLLQQKYSAAWVETKRFGINSSVGVLGLRDQASRWQIFSHGEDFGQTLAYYQVGEGCFLNLPFLGPSNPRDAFGMILGIPCSLNFWLLDGSAAWAFSGFDGFNNAAAHAESLNSFFSSNYDSYPLTKAFYKLHREALNQDFLAPSTPGDPDQSLGYLRLQVKDKNFFRKARQRSVQLAGAASKLPYTCWPIENSRGIVVILPGLGGHRLSAGVTALAELLNSGQWSVLALSSSLNPDYFIHLPSAAPPGFFAEDSKQQALAIAAALRDMRKHYHLEEQPCSILGFSLGALNALFLSRLEAEGELPGFSVERYLAINPPADVITALGYIDEFFAIPESWPEEEREQRCRELYLKTISSLMTFSDPSNKPANLPLSLEESQFLIALNMRVNLAETIIASQKRLRQGFLQNDPGAFNKNALWAEALSLSFFDYMDKSVMPWYQALNTEHDASWLARESNLFALEESLCNNAKVRLFQNENDFLINQSQLAWYRQTFGERALLFPQGGHLGNLWHPDYQQLILKTLE